MTSAGRAPIPPIHLQRRTRVPRATAWAAITDPAIVARWFADVSPLGQVGAPYRIEFGDGTEVLGRVLSLEPGRRFSHAWRWAQADEGQATRVTWAVEPMSSGGSRIVLEHDGWADAGLGLSERDDHESYWDQYLDNLRELLDPDLPEPPDEVD
jgi:uncharacterized protein YndB with AHSA1/START domain